MIQIKENRNPPFKYIIGPCSMESKDIMKEIAAEVSSISKKFNIEVIFKASFDKANRTSVKSYRSVGIEKGLEYLSEIKSEYKIMITTDVHETWQVKLCSGIIDIIQIPAFLCRQTELLVESGRHFSKINIKKGQFMAPEDMKYAVEKVKSGNSSLGFSDVWVTERGTTFGYHNLVVDMRSIPIIRGFAPCIFDVTHSTQRPGALNGSSGGDSKWAPFLARAAAAVGVDGFFIETHPNPPMALSDGPLMVPLRDLPQLIQGLESIRTVADQISTR